MGGVKKKAEKAAGGFVSDVGSFAGGAAEMVGKGTGNLINEGIAQPAETYLAKPLTRPLEGMVNYVAKQGMEVLGIDKIGRTLTGGGVDAPWSGFGPPPQELEGVAGTRKRTRFGLAQTIRRPLGLFAPKNQAQTSQPAAYATGKSLLGQ